MKFMGIYGTEYSLDTKFHMCKAPFAVFRNFSI